MLTFLHLIITGKVAEAEVLDINDRLSALSAQNSSLAAAGRKSANDYAVAKSELDDAISAANAAEDRARKAISDVSFSSLMKFVDNKALIHYIYCA